MTCEAGLLADGLAACVASATIGRPTSHPPSHHPKGDSGAALGANDERVFPVYSGASASVLHRFPMRSPASGETQRLTGFVLQLYG